LIAALSCGIEAEMLGSLMMFASGVVASSPSSPRASPTRWSPVRWSGNSARIRPPREMSRVSTSTPAEDANACTTGRNEYVASIGASSVSV
jgi:hypothetical protein